MHAPGARRFCTRVLRHQRPRCGITASDPSASWASLAFSFSLVPIWTARWLCRSPAGSSRASPVVGMQRWPATQARGHLPLTLRPSPRPPPRPLHRGLLLRHRTAALGVAGPRRAPAWLLGPEPQLPVVPSRRTARPVPVGRAARPAARRVEAVSWMARVPTRALPARVSYPRGPQSSHFPLDAEGPEEASTQRPAQTGLQS